MSTDPRSVVSRSLATEKEVKRFTALFHLNLICRTATPSRGSTAAERQRSMWYSSLCRAECVVPTASVALSCATSILLSALLLYSLGHVWFLVSREYTHAHIIVFGCQTFVYGLSQYDCFPNQKPESGWPVKLQSKQWSKVKLRTPWRTGCRRLLSFPLQYNCEFQSEPFL